MIVCSAMTRTNHITLTLTFAVSLMCGALTAEPTSEVDLPPELIDRYEVLIAELRCPKCLNINIADSNAPIATDLRNVVQSQLREGKTNAEIKAFLRERYGDFIDYNPPLSPSTLALWAIPLILLICAAIVFTYVGSKRGVTELSDEEKTRLQQLKAKYPS